MRVDAIYRDGYAITPSNSVNLPQRVDAIYVGGAGDLVVQSEGGNNITFPSVPAGGLIPFSTQKVLASTTATSLVGLMFYGQYGIVGGSTGSGGSAESDPFIFDDSGNPLLADDGTQLTL